MMSIRLTLASFFLLSVSTCFSITAPTFGQLLYSENFDDLGAASRWTANAGIGFDSGTSGVGAPGPLDTSFDQLPASPSEVDGINDTFDDFAFDYSVHGVPPSPNGNDPNSTIGMRLRTNLFSERFGGFSVSPTGLDLTGNYSIRFDYWGSSIGPFPFGGSSSTMHSAFGLLTSGTESQAALNTDGVYFTVTADGGSSGDYRVYSAAQDFSHQCCSASDDVIDSQATYHAGSRNGSAASGLYYAATVDPNQEGITVPASVQLAVENLYGDPNANPADFIMAGPLFGGAGGFQWHEMEIRKIENNIEWKMNGFRLISFDTSDWYDPNTPFDDANSNGTIDHNTGGTNISFGHHDVNFVGPSDDMSRDLVYTLIDNIRVNVAVPEPASQVLLLSTLALALLRRFGK